MNNMYNLAEQSGLPDLFPYSLVFPHYESLTQIRFELKILISIASVILFLISITFQLRLKKTIFVFFSLISLFTVPIAILQTFQNLTINFASSLWFYLLPMIYLDGLLHFVLNRHQSRWLYNRVALSLLLSLSSYFLLSLETYVYEVIFFSLFYQSILFILLVNVILPSFFRLFSLTNSKKKRNEQLLRINLKLNEADSANNDARNGNAQPK